jgi:nitroreductase
MPQDRPPALDFLLRRRSHPARTLALPVPGRDELAVILEAAARVPDHGKLEPWRFVVLGPSARGRIADAIGQRGAQKGLEPEAIAKARAAFEGPQTVVAVVACPRPSDSIPEIEQTLSAGAVCLSLLNAALAAGWGANWLTGWVSRDREILEGALGLAAQEWIAGFVHIGTATAQPPERPRPDLGRIVTWADG